MVPLELGPAGAGRIKRRAFVPDVEAQRRRRRAILHTKLVVFQNNITLAVGFAGNLKKIEKKIWKKKLILLYAKTAAHAQTNFGFVFFKTFM